MIISGRIVLRMRNVINKSLWRQSKHLYSIHFFFDENRSVYEIMWKNMVEPDSTIRRRQDSICLPDN